MNQLVGYVLDPRRAKKKVAVFPLTKIAFTKIGYSLALALPMVSCTSYTTSSTFVFQNAKVLQALLSLVTFSASLSPCSSSSSSVSLHVPILPCAYSHPPLLRTSIQRFKYQLFSSQVFPSAGYFHFPSLTVRPFSCSTPVWWQRPFSGCAR